MTKLLENKESNGQKIWVIAIRVIGFLLFLAPLFKPFIAYFKEETEKVTLDGSDWVFLLFGLILSSGGKQIGMVVNNVGIIFTKFLEKLTK